MTTPTRPAPARRAARRPPAHPRAPAPRRPTAAPPERPASFERVFLWSLLVSGALHLLILVLSPLFIGVGVPPGDVGSSDPSAAPVARGMEAIVAVPSTDAPETPADVPPVTRSTPITRATATPPERAVPAEGAVTTPSPSGARPDQTPATSSVGDALRPGFRDARLWVNPREIRLEREASRHEQYMQHVQARIDAQNDSTYGRGPDTDWTTTDAEGRKWGVSEKGIHLGGITIPPNVLPIPRTGTNQEQEEARERARQREEIIRQERAREREEAREASRRAAEARRKGGGGGG